MFYCGAKPLFFLCFPFFLLQVMIPVGVGRDGGEGESPEAIAHMPGKSPGSLIALWTNGSIVHDEE